MRSPEMSSEAPAAPPVLLLLSSALGLWAVIIVATATLWPRTLVAPHATTPTAAPQAAHEARVIKMARVNHVSPVTQVRPTRRSMVGKVTRKRSSLASRTFATNSIY